MLELLFLAIAPAAFLIWYIWKQDSYEPEPLHLVAWVFFLGALAVIPAAVIELLFPEGVVSSAFVAPVVEEAAKFLVVFLAIYRNPEFDEPMDGIVYAAAAGLGFATIENILYVLEGGIAVGIIRAIASVPGHVIFSCIWGLALGRAKFRPASGRTVIVIAGLFLAMLLHGIFNFSLSVFEALGLLLIIVVIIPFSWWMTCRNIKSAHADPASACSAINNLQSMPGIAKPGEPSPLPQAYPASPAAPSPAGAASAKSGPDSTQHFCSQCGAPDTWGKRFCGNCGKEF